MKKKFIFVITILTTLIYAKEDPTKTSQFLYPKDRSVNVSFRSDRGNKNLVYKTYSDFTVYGSVEITYETLYHQTRINEWNVLNKKIDTVISVSRWNETENDYTDFISHDDNSGVEFMSKLTVKLEKGKYRLSVFRRYLNEDFPLTYTPIVDIIGKCSGEGCTPPVVIPNCTVNVKTDWGCLVAGDAYLTKTNYNELPKVIQIEYQKIDRMTKTRFSDVPGGYSANISGVYKIFDSMDKNNPIGYYIQVFGSGEPDYNEQLDFVFDLNGNDVYENQEDW